MQVAEGPAWKQRETLNTPLEQANRQEQIKNGAPHMYTGVSYTVEAVEL